MRKIKGFSLLLIFCIVMLLISGCGSTSNSPNDSNNASAGNQKSGKIKLVVSSLMTQENRLDLMKKTIAIYNKTHPDVTIVYSVTPQTDYYQHLKLAFGAGNAEDIIYTDDLSQQFLQSYLMDLTDAVNERNWRDKQTTGAIEYTNIRTPGKFFSIPFLMAPVGVYYNKDIFAKLSLSPPKTIEEFNNILAKSKEAGYIPMENGGLQNYNLMWSLYNLIMGQVALDDVKKWYYREETTPAFKQAFQSSLKQIDDWIKKGYYRKDMTSIDGTNLPALFGQGKSALMVDGDWDLSAVESTKMNAGFFVFPPTDPQLHAIVNATDGAWALNGKMSPEKKKAAIDFIDVFMEPEVIKMWYESGLTPSVKFDGSKASVTPLKKELNAAVADTEIGYFLDNTVPGLLDVITKETQMLALQQITPEQCWDHIDAEYEKLKAAAANKK